ncbi:hypothetical protein [Paraburkholderia sp. SIMBA_027]|uniref:hypothetical protein n=1 Tax=Paraburkholderia sp. SIMBA_027 TaxID=3085770 RepID=UPI00397A8C5F
MAAQDGGTMKKARDRKGRGLFVGFAPEGIERESSRLRTVLFVSDWATHLEMP